MMIWDIISLSSEQKNQPSSSSSSSSSPSPRRHHPPSDLPPPQTPQIPHAVHALLQLNLQRDLVRAADGVLVDPDARLHERPHAPGHARHLLSGARRDGVVLLRVGRRGRGVFEARYGDREERRGGGG